MREKLIKSVKKLRFKHTGEHELPQAKELSDEFELLERFDIDEESFAHKYDLILDLEQKAQDFLFMHDLYLIEEKETLNKTVLTTSIEKIDLNKLIELVEFNDIRLATQKTMNIFLRNQNTIGKAVNEKVGAEGFIEELFEKARLSQISDIYIRLLGLELSIEYLKNVGKEVVATFGVKEATLIRNVLARMAIKEASERHYSAQIYLGKHEYRIQFFETAQGYTATIRVYGTDESGDAFNLASLGYLEEEQAALRSICSYQYGLVLMVAQTGQGKTTTQYAMMEELADKNFVVISIENPVEKRLKKVSQIDLSRYATAEGKFKYTALDAVRDVLRAKPDVINMGEIRTIEEIKQAYTAASTGHLVLATLHANDVAFAIDRLVKEGGLSVYDLKAILRGIVYQYLTRKLCPYCKELVSGTTYRRHKEGCMKCQQGYLSRTPVTEIAHFKFREDYEFADTKTYEFYSAIEASATRKYELGFIDDIHKEIVIKGLREPEISELNNVN